MCTEIREQHKIILSMYYHDRLRPGMGNIPQTKIDLDLTELLLLMRIVYGTIHYKISINKYNRTIIVYIDKSYDNLVSEEEILCDFGILKSDYLECYDENDYKNIDFYGVEPKRNLFFYNVLTTFINCNYPLKDRKALSYYLLYDNEGKKLISYLKNRLIELVNRICHSDKYGYPDALIDSMDIDYEDLKSLFEKADTQLPLLFNRLKDIGDSFDQELINEKLFMKLWIMEHKNYTDSRKYSFLNFVYGESKINPNHRIVMELIYQINRISKQLGVRELTNTWNRCIDGYNHDKYYPLEMYYMKLELDHLTENCFSAGFDIVVWGDNYINQVNSVLI